jgi:hypothetical protein
MTEATPPPAAEPGGQASAGSDWREQRRAERRARREARWQARGGRSYAWAGGAFLILLGIVFLMQNLGVAFLTNWWALFILIPAFWAFVGAWNLYQDSGRWTRGAIGSFIVGLLFTGLSLVFLFDLAIGSFWPLLLIAGGVLLVATAFVPE